MKSPVPRPPAAAQNALVCFALEEEAAAFRRLVAGRPDVTILLTGIGRENARVAVGGFLKQNSPRGIFTCGYAGGLRPELKVGDVLYATGDVALAKSLAGAGAMAAEFFCAPRIASTAAEKAELRRTTGADAVEMESEVIQEICRERGLPCATVRVISDAAQDDLPLDFNELSNPDQSLNYARLAWAVVKAPGKIPALLRLQRQTRFAAERLARVLARVV